MNPEDEQAAIMAKLQQAKLMMGGAGPNPMAPVAQPGYAPPAEQDYTMPSYKGISAQPTTANALAEALHGWQSGRSMRDQPQGKPGMPQGSPWADALRRAGKIGMGALEHPVSSFKSFFG